MSHVQKPASSRRKIALPAEHGSWGLTAEPIALGLLVAFSLPGLLMGVAVMAAFLMHQPFRVLWIDRRRGQSSSRTQIARQFILLFGVIASLSLMAVLLIAGVEPFVPWVVSLPLIFIYLRLDLQGEGRSWLAEVAAATAFAATAASIALAVGWPMNLSLALWGVMVARSVPSVLYVRARLRLERGDSAENIGAIAAHLVALLAVLLLIGIDLLPELAALAILVLLVRAIWGLSRYRWRTSVRTLGFTELGFGALTVILVALGYPIGS